MLQNRPTYSDLALDDLSRVALALAARAAMQFDRITMRLVKLHVCHEPETHIPSVIQQFMTSRRANLSCNLRVREDHGCTLHDEIRR